MVVQGVPVELSALLLEEDAQTRVRLAELVGFFPQCAPRPLCWCEYLRLAAQFHWHLRPLRHLSAVQFGKLPDRNGFVGRQLSDESLRIGTGQPSDQIVDKSSHVGKIGAGDRPRYSRNCAPALTPRARTP